MIRSKYDSVILIGPLATGKSTIGYALSDRLNCPNYPIDRLKWYYRFKNGYNLIQSKKLLAEKGFGEFLKYAHHYFTTTDLENVFSTFKGVVDLGATDSYADNDMDRFNELKRIFKKYPNVFLILPSPSIHECEDILTNRLLLRYENDPLKKSVIDSYIEMNNKFISSSSNFTLSKQIIYTAGKNIDEITSEIISKCSFSNSTMNFNNVGSKRRAG